MLSSFAQRSKPSLLDSSATRRLTFSLPLVCSKHGTSSCQIRSTAGWVLSAVSSVRHASLSSEPKSEVFWSDIATGAVVNALWELYAKKEKKPLWQLVADFTPEEFVAATSFRYITDAITPDEALELLRSKQAGKAERLEKLKALGYPAYTTSVSLSPVVHGQRPRLTPISGPFFCDRSDGTSFSLALTEWLSLTL